MKNPLIKLTIKSAPLLLRHYLPGSSIVFSAPKGKSKSYIIPSSIKGELLEEYNNTQDWLYKNYQVVSRNKRYNKFARDIAPFSQLVDIKINANRQIVRQAAEKLTQIDDKYFKTLAKSLISACGESLRENKLSKFVDKIVAEGIPSTENELKLVGYQPGSETELIIDVLQGDSWLSYEEAVEAIEDMKYKEKNKLLKQALKSNSSLTTKYDFEAVTEPFRVHKIVQNGEVDAKGVQIPSPYHGYDIQLQDDNETISTLMERSYDLSYKLYSMLQEFGGNDLAQLAVLSGHRQRYLFSTDHRRLKDSKSDILQSGIEQVSLIHPTLFDI